MIAFLDIAPIRSGHTQILPKAHIPYFELAPPDLIMSIVCLGQKLAVAMKRLYGVPRFAFLFTGGDIAPMHAHVIPMHQKTDITSQRYIVESAVTFQELPRAEPSELAAVANDLRRTLAAEVGRNLMLPANE